MSMIANPKRTATTIKIVLVKPLTPNDIRIKIVETTNPEFLIILWNLKTKMNQIEKKLPNIKF